MTIRPLYIFDIDGTLALIEHRVKILDNKDDPNRWRKFYAACDKDLPNFAVIRVMEILRLAGADILLFSGRSAEVKDKTVKWLADCTSFMSWELYGPMLTMRDEGDYTPDDVLKKEWLDNLLLEDRQRLVGWFDDRDRVVKMVRENGITCFQVANGEF